MALSPDQMKEMLAELDPVRFNQWRHHPVTRMFLQFLADQTHQDRQTLLALWEAKNLTPQVSDELRGRVNVCEELQTLTLSAMRLLYGVPDPEAEQLDEEARGRSTEAR